MILDGRGLELDAIDELLPVCVHLVGSFHPVYHGIRVRSCDYSWVGG